jgi:hypothetical protein
MVTIEEDRQIHNETSTLLFLNPQVLPRDGKKPPPTMIKQKPRDDNKTWRQRKGLSKQADDDDKVEELRRGKSQ